LAFDQDNRRAGEKSEVHRLILFRPPFLSSSYLILAEIDNAKRAGMVAPVAKP
jgi:hypothetical protein